MMRRIKKALCAVIIISFVLSVMPVNAFADASNDADTALLQTSQGTYAIPGTNIVLTYNVYNGRASIYSCNREASGVCVVPEKINGYTVTSIGMFGFEDCSNLTQVVLPKTVAGMGDESPSTSFYRMPNLTRIDVEEGGVYSSIDGVLYYKNSSMSAASLEIVPMGKRIQQLTIPDTVSMFDEESFSNCSGIQSLAIPTSVTTIKNGAFFECQDIGDVYYAGSEAQWNAISIGSSFNTALTNANIHFNSTGPETGAAPSPMADGKLLSFSGSGRYETMEMLVNSGSFAKGQSVVLATGENYADALAATGFAGTKNAPIILTSGDSLSIEARAMLKLLQPADIYLTGGSGAVSDNVKLTVRAMLPNASLHRFSGADRYETARNIYSGGSGWSSQAIVVDGSNYADALSIAPYAYAAKCPIFLSDRTSGLDSSSLKDIQGGGFTSVILVGGTGVVPAAVESQLGSISHIRLAGQNRYGTCADIDSWLDGSSTKAIQPLRTLSYKKPAVATGNGFADALAGAAWCAQNGSVLILADDSAEGMTCIEGNLKQHSGEAEQVAVLGGTGVVSQNMRNEIKDILNGN